MGGGMPPKKLGSTGDRTHDDRIHSAARYELRHCDELTRGYSKCVILHVASICNMRRQDRNCPDLSAYARIFPRAELIVL